jgi:hypothetical protein
VNELILRRRCACLEELTQEETKLRMEAEKNVIEMEACLKERLLYLEEWKLSASERLERQAAALEKSRPNV